MEVENSVMNNCNKNNFEENILMKNVLQEKINLVDIKISMNPNNNFCQSKDKKDINNFFNKIEVPIQNQKNEELANQLIFFNTEQYRNLLAVFVSIDYGKEIIKNLNHNQIQLKEVLNRHKITERMRSKMVDWMIEVTENYRCDTNTYFLGVSLLDRYFENCKNCLNADDLHKLGITCMFIASKYCDVFPIKLQMASDKISHGKISKEEIKSAVIEIMKIIEYDLSIPTSFELLNFYIEDIFNVNENNYNIRNEVLREYLRNFKEIQMQNGNNFDENFYELLNDKNLLYGNDPYFKIYKENINTYNSILEKIMPLDESKGIVPDIKEYYKKEFLINES